MEGGVIQQKGGTKVDLAEVALPGLEAAGAAGGGGGGGGGLARQGSMSKNNCLCSPTTHAGSFRCRLHRAPPPPGLLRTKSIDSTTTILHDSSSQSKPSFH